MIKCHALKETNLERRRRFAEHILTILTEANFTLMAVEEREKVKFSNFELAMCISVP